MKIFRYISKKLFHSKDEKEEIAAERRQRFIREADSIFSIIPLPNKDQSSLWIAEIRPDNPFELGSITWGIKTSKGEKFMFAGRFPNGDESRWIVMAKTRYLYAAWAAGRDQKNGGRGNPPILEDILAENPWVKENEKKVWTFKNPVAIPNIGSNFTINRDYHIQFVAGEHRTRWVIAHGAVIPVETNTEEAAHALHAMMGIELYPPATVLDWIGRQTKP